MTSTLTRADIGLALVRVAAEGRQRRNRAMGLPCYCAMVWPTRCDFCTGTAPLDGARAEYAIAELAAGRGKA